MKRRNFGLAHPFPSALMSLTSSTVFGYPSAAHRIIARPTPWSVLA